MSRARLDELAAELEGIRRQRRRNLEAVAEVKGRIKRRASGLLPLLEEGALGADSPRAAPGMNRAHTSVWHDADRAIGPRRWL